MAAHYAFTRDVFLNFRGPDTGNSFTAFLYDHLKREGLDVYIDREDLRAGQEIELALYRAIQESKISIPIFSKGYADSRWCLDELVKMDRHRREYKQTIIPVFFDVEPTVVRFQTDSFQASFQRHEDEKHFNEQTRNGWKKALKSVAEISGCPISQVNGDQLKLVELVVGAVLSESIPGRLSDVKYSVGLDDPDGPVQNLSSLLNLKSNDDVQIWGICGIGGIGKTTITKALYNKICNNFNMRCFLPNIREEASRPQGLVSLQEQLLYSCTKMGVSKIWNVHEGQQLIKKRLQGQKVLLILDDVHCRSQLDALAIHESQLFGPGSRIILTSRDEHILNLAKVNEHTTYWPEKLTAAKSLKLFSLHAFSVKRPLPMYEMLSQEVIRLAGGLPLTLEVLGSSLCNIRENNVCQSMLQKLERIPHREVHKKLKISYENLDDEEKSMFLDAACFFVGWKKEIVTSIWEACGYHPTAGIKKLTQTSLLRFTANSSDSDGKLTMDDEIQAMGKGIIYEESPLKLGNRSRLWDDDEIFDVFKDHKGTQMIEGIIPSSDNMFSRVCLNERDFETMSNLRILNADGASYEGHNFPSFPSSLIWLCWRRCPLETIPSNFYLNKLVHIDLSWSLIRQAWTDEPPSEYQKFQNLKVLCLRHCYRLEKSPNFSRFPRLETLDLGWCGIMVDLNASIGVLTSLVNLSLDETSITALPDTICGLSCLRHLTLKSCSSLQSLPSSIGSLRSLVTLSLDGTGIEVLPDSICRLNSLQSLTLAMCSSFRELPNQIDGLQSLAELSLDGTIIEQLPPTFNKLESLRALKLSRCSSLQSLHDSIGDLQSLEELILDGCVSLNALSESITDLSPTVGLSILGTNLVLSERVRHWLSYRRDR